MIIGVQLIAILFSLFLFYVTFIHFKKGQLSTLEALFFSTIWLGSIFVTLFPKSLNFVLNTFNILRLLDLATIAGFMLLIGIAFRNYIRIRDLERRIEKIVRNEALGNAKKTKKHSNNR